MNNDQPKSMLEIQRELTRLRSKIDNQEKWCDLVKNMIDQIQDLIFEIKESTHDW